MLGRLRSLDVYRKIPKDYTESTLSGALSTPPFILLAYHN